MFIYNISFDKYSSFFLPLGEYSHKKISQINKGYKYFCCKISNSNNRQVVLGVGHGIYRQRFHLLEDLLLLGAVEHDAVGDQHTHTHETNTGTDGQHERHDWKSTCRARHCNYEPQTVRFVEHAPLLAVHDELVGEAKVEARRGLGREERQVKTPKRVLGQALGKKVVVTIPNYLDLYDTTLKNNFLNYAFR